MRRILKLLIILLILTWVAPAMAGPAAELPVVTFIPQWVPQAQFAGFYLAEEKGFFREQGITVRILEGGPSLPPTDLLASGKADFGTLFLGRGLEVRAQGLPVVNLAQLVQRSSLMLVARRGSGITRPEDLNGRRVGMWGDEYQIQPRAFFRKFRLAITPVSQGTTANLFLRGGVDMISAMWYNEYHMLLNAGLEPGDLTPFFFFDYGLNMSEDGIYCLASTWAAKPALCRAFVRASLKGWRYAFAHPDEAVDVVLRRAEAAKVSTNRAHQEWMLARMRDIMLPDRPGFGILKREDYQRVAAELRSGGQLQGYPPYEKFFVMGLGDE